MTNHGTEGDLVHNKPNLISGDNALNFDNTNGLNEDIIVCDTKS